MALPYHILCKMASLLRADIMALPYHILCKMASLLRADIMASCIGHRADELQLQKLFCRLCRQSLDVYKYHFNKYSSSITRAGELLLKATGMESDFFTGECYDHEGKSADNP